MFCAWLGMPRKSPARLQVLRAPGRPRGTQGGEVAGMGHSLNQPSYLTKALPDVAKCHATYWLCWNRVKCVALLVRLRLKDKTLHGKKLLVLGWKEINVSFVSQDAHQRASWISLWRSLRSSRNFVIMKMWLRYGPRSWTPRVCSQAAEAAVPVVVWEPSPSQPSYCSGHSYVSRRFACLDYSPLVFATLTQLAWVTVCHHTIPAKFRMMLAKVRL